MSELEYLCRQVWGAYEFLYNHDLADQSGTSKRLRAGNPAKLKARLIEELGELRGVIEGTHFHEGFDQDIILEGYEVWYWAVCLAVSLGLTYQGLDPASPLQSSFEAVRADQPSLLSAFSARIAALETSSSETAEAGLIADLTSVFGLIGAACRLNDTDPRRLIERDRAEMRQKAYLTAYWQLAATRAD